MSLLTSKRKARVEIYSKADCHLCEVAKALLLKVQKRIPFELTEVDISRNAELNSLYKEQIPVIFIDGKKAFKFKVDETELIRKLKRVS